MADRDYISRGDRLQMPFHDALFDRRSPYAHRCQICLGFHEYGSRRLFDRTETKGAGTPGADETPPSWLVHSAAEGPTLLRYNTVSANNGGHTWSNYANGGYNTSGIPFYIQLLVKRGTWSDASQYRGLCGFAEDWNSNDCIAYSRYAGDNGKLLAHSQTNFSPGVALSSTVVFGSGLFHLVGAKFQNEDSRSIYVDGGHEATDNTANKSPSTALNYFRYGGDYAASPFNSVASMITTHHGEGYAFHESLLRTLTDYNVAPMKAFFKSKVETRAIQWKVPAGGGGGGSAGNVSARKLSSSFSDAGGRVSTSAPPSPISSVAAPRSSSPSSVIGQSTTLGSPAIGSSPLTQTIASSRSFTNEASPKFGYGGRYELGY